MDALLLADTRPNIDALRYRRIAGATLISRQLAWLQTIGVERVIINTVGRISRALRQEAQTVGLDLAWVPSARPLTPYELSKRARRAGGPMLLVQGPMLGDAALDAATCTPTDRRVAVLYQTSDGPGPLLADPDSVPKRCEVRNVDGWITTPVDETSAHALELAILRGDRPGPLVVGTEVSPMIFLTRGARIAKSVKTQGPVYLGRGAMVEADAQLSNGVVLGERTVVGAGTVLSNVRVDDDVAIGPGLSFRDAFIRSNAVEWHDGRVTRLDDPMFLRGRGERFDLGRALAKVATGALSAVGSDPRDIEWISSIARGERAFIGVDERALIDVSPLYVPHDAEALERQAAQAIYQAEKSAWLDARLVLRTLLAAGGR